MSIQAALFGGTFNPIHNGHLMVVRRVLQQFFLERIFIIPCRLPPHKQPAFLAPAFQRVRMIERALPDDDRYRISDVELKRFGPSYTIDTVDHFRARLGSDATLFLPLGMDAFFEIHTWKSYGRLLEAVQPVIVTRHLEKKKAAEDDIQRLDLYIHSRLSDNYRYDRSRLSWRSAGGNPIHLLSVTPLDVSSSQIRQAIREEKTISGLVPASVGAYIEEKEIYR